MSAVLELDSTSTPESLLEPRSQSPVIPWSPSRFTWPDGKIFEGTYAKDVKAMGFRAAVAQMMSSLCC